MITVDGGVKSAPSLMRIFQLEGGVMDNKTELQTLALRIVGHKNPGMDLIEPCEKYDGEYICWKNGERMPSVYFEADNATMYGLWQEIAPKYVEKMRLRYMAAGLNGIDAQILAECKAYEAPRTPLGIAKAYCEVYGLES